MFSPSRTQVQAPPLPQLISHDLGDALLFNQHGEEWDQESSQHTFKSDVHISLLANSSYSNF